MSKRWTFLIVNANGDEETVTTTDENDPFPEADKIWRINGKAYPVKSVSEPDESQSPPIITVVLK